MKNVLTIEDTSLWPPIQLETSRGTLALASRTYSEKSTSRDAIIVGTDERVRNALIILSTQNKEDPDGAYLSHLAKAGRCVLKNNMNGLADLDKVQGELPRTEKCDFRNARGTGVMVNLGIDDTDTQTQWSDVLHNVAIIHQMAGSRNWVISNDFNYHGFGPIGTGNMMPTRPYYSRERKPERIIAMSRGMHDALTLRGDMKDTHFGADLSSHVKKDLEQWRDESPSTIAQILIITAHNALMMGPEFQRQYPFEERPSLTVGVWDIDKSAE